LAVLPSRASDNADVDKGAYYEGLKGVTWHGISEATRGILRGSLRHTFFPTPVELRQQHDAVMTWHLQERRRTENLQRQAQERRRIDEIHAQRTPESLARVDATYKAFCAGRADNKKPVERVYLDPELVAQVPDAPKSFKRIA
jgi:hypothetical protein